VGRHAMQGRTWLYDDVAHLALMIADPGAVASFVKRELRGLLGPGERLADIRTTVKIYLDQAHSRVAVAEALHIASNTVAYRVGQAGELLGYPVTDRAQLILLALQLYENFPHWVTEPPPR